MFWYTWELIDNRINAIISELGISKAQIESYVDTKIEEVDFKIDKVSEDLELAEKVIPTDLGYDNGFTLYHDTVEITGQTNKVKLGDNLSYDSVTNTINAVASEQIKVVTIEAIPTATEGILTDEQLQVLQENDSNYIMFNHEKFYLNDKGHTEGFLTYSHLGYENNNMYAKTITITINTKSWVLKSIAVQPYNFDSIGGGLRVEDGVLKSNVTFTQDATTLNITLLED